MTDQEAVFSQFSIPGRFKIKAFPSRGRRSERIFIVGFPDFEPEVQNGKWSKMSTFFLFSRHILPSRIHLRC